MILTESIGNEPITHEALRKMKFYQCGWGSPHIRQGCKVDMYEKIQSGTNPCSIMYFPKDFEGWARFCSYNRVNVRGRIVICNQNNNDTWISPVLDNLMDFKTFIKAVADGLIEPHRYNFKPKYSDYGVIID